VRGKGEAQAGKPTAAARTPGTSSLPDRVSLVADGDRLPRPGVGRCSQGGTAHPRPRPSAPPWAAVPACGGKPGCAPARPAPTGSVDRWPLASRRRQIPGGKPPAGAAVRRRVCGWCPPPEGCMLQAIRAWTGRRMAPAADHPLGNTVGAIGWSQGVLRCAAGSIPPGGRVV
jgi:hypothetical protein